MILARGRRRFLAELIASKSIDRTWGCRDYDKRVIDGFNCKMVIPSEGPEDLIRYILWIVLCKSAGRFVRFH